MTPADRDDAIDAHARAYAALTRAADDEAHALSLYKSAAERKAALSQTERTLRARLHGLFAGRDPATIPEPDGADRVPCPKCGAVPCVCKPPKKGRPRKQEAGAEANPTPPPAAASAAASPGDTTSAPTAAPAISTTATEPHANGTLFGPEFSPPSPTAASEGR